MEIFGLHEHIKDLTRRLGKLGAFATKAHDLLKSSLAIRYRFHAAAKCDLIPARLDRHRGKRRRSGSAKQPLQADADEPAVPAVEPFPAQGIWWAQALDDRRPAT
jgi:hypothetical protein